MPRLIEITRDSAGILWNPHVPNTNEFRKKQREIKRALMFQRAMDPTRNNSPLQNVSRWLNRYPAANSASDQLIRERLDLPRTRVRILVREGGLRGCPMNLLEPALIHCEQRMLILADLPSNAKNRSRVRWLGNWIQAIDREISRRRLRVIK